MRETVVEAGTDVELWRRARVESDPPAFGQLFVRHSAAVYTHCFRMTGDWTMAEDLTSVVFLEAWRRRRDVVLSEGSLLPWLIGVANNVSRNARRTVQRHKRLLAKLPPAGVEDSTDDVVQRLDAAQTMQSVRAVFAQLSKNDQDVIAACLWAGLTYEQAAVALGLPVGTIRSRLSRARSRLRTLVQQQNLAR